MKTGLRQKYNNHKNWKTGWKYKKDAPYDLEWQKDRSKLFKESGNGWWMLMGTPELIKHLDRIKKENEMP